MFLSVIQDQLNNFQELLYWFIIHALPKFICSKYVFPTSIDVYRWNQWMLQIIVYLHLRLTTKVLVESIVFMEIINSQQRKVGITGWKFDKTKIGKINITVIVLFLFMKPIVFELIQISSFQIFNFILNILSQKQFILTNSLISRDLKSF